MIRRRFNNSTTTGSDDNDNNNSGIQSSSSSHEQEQPRKQQQQQQRIQSNAKKSDATIDDNDDENDNDDNNTSDRSILNEQHGILLSVQVPVVVPSNTIITSSTSVITAVPTTETESVNNKQQLILKFCYNHTRNVQYYIFHVISIVLIIYSISITKRKQQSKKECTMTWSRRQFVQIIFDANANDNNANTTNYNDMSQQSTKSTSNNNNFNSYKLYKFFDTRDPRHNQFLVSIDRDKQSDWMNITIPIRTTTSTSTKNNNNNSSEDDNKNCWIFSNPNPNPATIQQKSRRKNINKSIVLFIPGHYGTYQQSRSIGAHGIQLTHESTIGNKQLQQWERILYKYLVQSNNSNNNNNNNNSTLFLSLFDVFAIDFNREGSGYHGLIIQNQAKYIQYIINTITTTCSSYVQSIIIVAHSIGTISTLVASTSGSTSNNNYNNNKIVSIIALGSPIQYPILSWSTSMYNIYYNLKIQLQLQQQQQQNDINNNNTNTNLPTIVSISGGIVDEMIPPSSCHYSLYNNIHKNNNNNNNIITATTWLATDWLKVFDIDNNKTTNNNSEQQQQKQVVQYYFGMDHRSIVWCYQILTVVRSIIINLTYLNTGSIEIDINQQQQQPEMTFQTIYDTILKENNNKNSEKDRKMMKQFPIVYNYNQSVYESYYNHKKLYGYVQSILMQTIHLYSADILVTMYTCLGVLYYFFPLPNQGYERNNIRYNLLVKGSSEIVILLAPLILSILQYTIIQMKQQQSKMTTVLWWWQRSGNSYNNSNDLYINYNIPFGVIVIIAYISDTIFRLLHFIIVTIITLYIKFHQQVLTSRKNTSTTTCTKILESSSTSSKNDILQHSSHNHRQQPLMSTIFIFVKFCTLWILVWAILFVVVQTHPPLYQLIWFWLLDVSCCFCFGSFFVMYSLIIYLFVIIVEIRNNININIQSKDDIKSESQQSALRWIEQQLQLFVLFVPILLVISWGELVSIVKGYVGYTSPIASVPLSTLPLWCLPIVGKLLLTIYQMKKFVTRFVGSSESVSSLTTIGAAATIIDYKYQKRDKFRQLSSTNYKWLIHICNKFVTILLIWHYRNVMYFVRGPLNGIHIYHPITKLILLLVVIDSLQILQLLSEEEFRIQHINLSNSKK